jgi:ribose-phosphate pyrophosphokinase
VSDVVIFSGCANEPLAASIAAQFGAPLGRRTIRRFADGEVSISIDESVA